MKTNYLFLTLLAILVFPIYDCKKKEAIKELPTLSTTAASDITSGSFSSGGNISSDGGAEILSRGVCWGTTQNPTISASKTTNGTGTGIFTSPVTGLLPGTTYYFRAYATNSVGIAYGPQQSTTTIVVLPELTTTSITTLTATSATSGGNITTDGGSAVTARGVCWGIAQNPTISNSKTTNGTGTGTFSSLITDLLPGTTYYLRSYATNSIGTVYGNEYTINTLVLL